MLKSLLVLINYFVFALIGLLLQRIEVTQNLPAKLNPGEAAEVQVSIVKGKVEGFAKFQINVEPGLIIEPIENSGASFTFNDQKAKFIWMSVPTGNTITLKYRLKALPNSNGVKKVESTFSYIDENQRLVFDAPVQYVATGNAEPVVKQTNTASNNTNALATVTRKVTPLQDGRFKVELLIEKSGIEGFAKLQEEIPADYTAIGSDGQGSVFNIVDQRVKFVWFSLPENPQVTLSYELIPVLKEPTLNFELSGEFSFLVQNETRSVPVSGDYTKVTAAEVAIATTSLEEHFEELDRIAQSTDSLNLVLKSQEQPLAQIENNILNEVTEDNIEVQNRAVAETLTTTQEQSKTIIDEETPKLPELVSTANEQKNTTIAPPVVSKAPNPEKSINYRVQITAGHKVVDSAYFKERHKFNGEFVIENHQGWVKYTTGKSENYRGARDQRNELASNYNFPGPFVVAYNDGERITVQEALMISNQKWLP
jgi:hypothetical protein